MIRNATENDVYWIAAALWRGWTTLKLQQIPSPIGGYKSRQILAAEIQCELTDWLVCESAEADQMGFFATSSIGPDDAHKRWGFPSRAISIRHFNFLLNSEILLKQYQLILERFHQDSILMCFSSTLRGPYWAALKSGFTSLGESQLVVGTFVWFYKDREKRFDLIRTKLRRARLLS